MQKRTLLVTSFLALGGCTQATESSPTVSVCEGVEPQRIAVNGKDLNGVQLNGIQLNRIAVNGADLVGVRVAGEPVVGASVTAVMRDGSSIALTIASGADGLFELTRDGANVCPNDEKGVFVPGIWDERAARHDSDTLSTFACESGAIGKCALWGYDPARVGAAMHQACTRMVRADYCGDGGSSTRDGTKIDVFDTRGVQTSANDSTFAFEAGWNENGATCVSRTRIAGVVPSCWRDLPTCNSAEEAVSRGASLLNASQPICH